MCGSLSLAVHFVRMLRGDHNIPAVLLPLTHTKRYSILFRGTAALLGQRSINERLFLYILWCRQYPNHITQLKCCMNCPVNWKLCMSHNGLENSAPFKEINLYRFQDRNSQCAWLLKSWLMTSLTECYNNDCVQERSAILVLLLAPRNSEKKSMTFSSRSRF